MFYYKEMKKIDLNSVQVKEWLSERGDLTGTVDIGAREGYL